MRPPWEISPALRLGAGRRPSRRAVIGGLVGAIAARASGASAEAQEPDVPVFQSGGYQFTLLRPQRELPAARLFGLDGRTTDLSALRGKPILLNFWATWCAACRTELPILSRLHDSSRGSWLHVMAISKDSGERNVVERFVRTFKIGGLPIYWDPNGYVGSSDGENPRNAPFVLYGMPITYLIAASGRVVGYMSGAADWTSEPAGRLIEYLRQA